MVEGPTERTVTKGMVRQRTFTKEEQSNSNLNNKEESESQEVIFLSVYASDWFRRFAGAF